MPRGALARIFRRAGFAPVEHGDGAAALRFANGREVLDWALETGVSAGFDGAMGWKD